MWKVFQIPSQKDEYLLARAMKRAKITNITLQEPNEDQQTIFEEKGESESSASSSSINISPSERPQSEKDGLI